MKLINADYLTGRMFTEADLNDAHTCYDSIRAIIESMETVNAIPMSVIEDIKAEIKEWYWQADKQAIAKDPCVVDAMVDLFIRTIDKHIGGAKK